MNGYEHFGRQESAPELPTSDLCDNACGRRRGPDVRKPLQKQAHQRAARITVSPPLLTALPHRSSWGTRGGYGEEIRTPDPTVNTPSQLRQLR
jgi:hypothetical protein